MAHGVCTETTLFAPAPLLRPVRIRMRAWRTSRRRQARSCGDQCRPPERGGLRELVAILLATGPGISAFIYLSTGSHTASWSPTSTRTASPISSPPTNRKQRFVPARERQGGATAPSSRPFSRGEGVHVVAGDFNEDGILTAVSMNSLAAVSVLLGQGNAGVGNGCWPRCCTQRTAREPVGAGRLNDGISPGRDRVLTRAAAFCWTRCREWGRHSVPPRNTRSKTVDVEVSDFNDDGILDLAVANGVMEARRFSSATKWRR